MLATEGAAATVGDAAQPLWDGFSTATMNMETALNQRLTESQYFRELSAKTTVGDVLEAIGHWDFPRDMAAWVAQEHDAGQPGQAQARNRHTSTVMVQGGIKGRDTPVHHGLRPSYMWCMLHRLIELRPTAHELREMLSKHSRAHVRCLAVLFVRLTQPPSEFLDWLQGPLEDTESTVLVAGSKVTVHEFTKSVVQEQRALGTIFVRVPEKVLRQFRKHLGEATAQDIEVDQREQSRIEKQQQMQQEKEVAGEKRKRKEPGADKGARVLADPSTAKNPAERRRLERLRRKQLAEMEESDAKRFREGDD
eukprot:TRINITY_DN14360_c0_g1_i1.p1 TRINITY_DN14360_c0_g1~~TRINITY_DN14360_c0_g1_i1.p1  ORF type:complete len:308 (+),score=49.43 TRINITY_DN14360_c0_g1_i1:90-1013(+)